MHVRRMETLADLANYQSLFSQNTLFKFAKVYVRIFVINSAKFLQPKYLACI